MSNQVQGAAFARATTLWAEGASAHDLSGQTGVSNVHSVLFDDLRARAGSGVALQGLRVQVLTLPLTRPSRRRVRVTLRGLLIVARLGEARASLSCESRRVSAQVMGRSQSNLPDGALPVRERSLTLTIALPRSVRPRTRIRLLVLLETDALNPESQAEAIVDSIDIEAL